MDQRSRDDETGDDEEDVDADKASRKHSGSQMIKEDGEDRDRAKAVDGREITESRSIPP